MIQGHLFPSKWRAPKHGRQPGEVSRLIDEAVRQFPARFRLKHASGTYRLAPNASYVSSRDRTIMLYAQRLHDSQWIDVTAATVEEFQAEVEGP